MAPRPESAVAGAAGESKKALTAVPSSGSAKSFTWQEVARHNTPESAWVIIDGKVYDVTDFAERHPGGREMLMLAAGRECTELFKMYHILTSDAGDATARKYLASLEIGRLEGPAEFPLYPQEDPKKGFYATLARRVREKFTKEGINPKNPLWGTLRMIPVMAVAVVTYLIMNGVWLADAHFAVKLLAAIVYGIMQAMPLLHVMHDSCHTAFGPNESWWKAGGRLTLDWFAGASMISWHHQHVVGHHCYTNVYQADPDMPNTDGDFRRHVWDQAYLSAYKWQWLYLPLVYGGLALRFRVQDVTEIWLARTCGPIRVNYYDNPLVRVFMVKGLWIFYRIVVPLYFLGVPHSTFWPLFFAAELASGYWLAWNFEVSHISDDVDFLTTDGTSTSKIAACAKVDVPAARTGGKASTAASAAVDAAIPELPESWAVAQVKTSVDYGHDFLSTYFSGALNYQIEHHLFPGVSQYLYPTIAPIVQQTCREFGLPYRYYPNFWQAWVGHVRHLYRLGQAGKPHHFE